MTNTEKRAKIFQRTYWQIAGVVLLLLVAVFLIWNSNANSYQATSAMVAQVRFWGEYRIGDGPWQEIIEGQHIPATKGDVMLRGNFHMLAPDGEYVGIYSGDLPVAFYSNHVNLTVYEKGKEPYTIDAENPLFGIAACGAHWTAYYLTMGSEEPLEILVHNPHSYGNENAIDEMLSNLALWTGIDFERDVLQKGETQRNAGLLLVIVSLVLLGTALFSSLLHIQNSRIMWLVGLTTFFAGVYLAYSSFGVLFWSESVVTNTILHGASLMFYMLFISSIITYSLKKTKRVGAAAVVAMGIMDGVYFLLPGFAKVLFYTRTY